LNGYELLNGPQFFLCCEFSVTCCLRELIDKAEKNMDAELKENVWQLSHIEVIAFYFFSALLLDLESISSVCEKSWIDSHCQ